MRVFRTLTAKEYGIIFAGSNVTGDFNADTETAWILPALTVTGNGEWAICVMDSNENGAELNGCRARTYVKSAIITLTVKLFHWRNRPNSQAEPLKMP